MSKLGTQKKPIIVRVHSDEKAKYVVETCKEHGWHYIMGFEPDKPEDISDLENALNPQEPVQTEKIGNYSTAENSHLLSWNGGLRRAGEIYL